MFTELADSKIVTAAHVVRRDEGPSWTVIFCKSIIPGGLFFSSHKSLILNVLTSVISWHSSTLKFTAKNFPDDSLARCSSRTSSNDARSLLRPDAQEHYKSAGPKLISILPHE